MDFKNIAKRIAAKIYEFPKIDPSKPAEEKEGHVIPINQLPSGFPEFVVFRIGPDAYKVLHKTYVQRLLNKSDILKNDISDLDPEDRVYSEAEVLVTPVGKKPRFVWLDDPERYQELCLYNPGTPLRKCSKIYTQDLINEAIETRISDNPFVGIDGPLSSRMSIIHR